MNNLKKKIMTQVIRNIKSVAIGCFFIFLAFASSDDNAKESESVEQNQEDVNSYTSNDGSDTWIPEGYSKGSDCSDCSGTGHYTHDVLGSPGSEGGICAGCNGRGYHLNKN